MIGESIRSACPGQIELHFTLSSRHLWVESFLLCLPVPEACHYPE